MAKLPAGSIEFDGVSLPIRPQLTGVLPFGLEIPDPISIDDTASNNTVFQPGGSRTVFIEGSDSRVITYTPTLDGRTVSGQVGPYAVLTTQVDSRPIVKVVLPPDVSAFILATRPIEGAMALLDALLSRLPQWSKEGCIVASRILRAIYRILGTYQSGLAAASAEETVDLHVYVAILKTIFGEGSRLLGGRANEAIGYDVPMIQQSAENAIRSVLDADRNA